MNVHDLMEQMQLPPPRSGNAPAVAAAEALEGHEKLNASIVAPAADVRKALAQHPAPLVQRVRTEDTAVKTRTGESVWTNEPLTEAALLAHVSGGKARGCPINKGESTTRVALLDFDSHKGETP